jgi:hypothetical protein
VTLSIPLPEPSPGLRFASATLSRSAGEGLQIAGLGAAVCLLLGLVLFAAPAFAADPAKCAPSSLVLWGDGQHDDTAALNAWLRGEAVVWGQSGEPVGPVVAGRTFLLSQAVYAPGGSGRTLERFRFLWPERHETVTGDALATGGDPDAPPAGTNIRITGGDRGEGVAVEAPDPVPSAHGDPPKCLIS